MSVALENRAIYIPAVGYTFWDKWKKNRRHRECYDLKWFSPRSFFCYPYALISAFYGKDYDRYWRHKSGYPKDYLLITDSGGYQLIENPSAIEPNASLRWQERNADVGFVLDVPPRKGSNFGDCLKKSVKNFQIFEQNRKNYDMKLYNVLQAGQNMNEMEMWYNAVKSFDFDGWCLSASSYKIQVQGYLMLHLEDARNLNGNFHLFGSTSMRTMFTMAMISHYFETPITFDSTSYTIGSRYREFLRPMNLKEPLSFGRNAKRIEVNPCNCPVCSRVTLDDLYSQERDALAPLLLDLHNMYWTIEVNKKINNLVDNQEALEAYAQSVGELKTVQYVQDMLDEYDSLGLL